MGLLVDSFHRGTTLMNDKPPDLVNDKPPDPAADWMLKKGLVRRLGAGETADAPHVVSLVGVIVLTVSVLLASWLTWHIWPLAPWTMKMRLSLIAGNVFFWLVAGAAWYRVAAGWPKPPISYAITEQGEGVWPPAPKKP